MTRIPCQARRLTGLMFVISEYLPPSFARGQSLFFESPFFSGNTDALESIYWNPLIRMQDLEAMEAPEIDWALSSLGARWILSCLEEGDLWEFINGEFAKEGFPLHRKDDHPHPICFP